MSKQTIYSTERDGFIRGQGDDYAEARASGGRDAIDTIIYLYNEYGYGLHGDQYAVSRGFLYFPLELPDSAKVTGVKLYLAAYLKAEEDTDHSDVYVFEGTQDDILIHANFYSFTGDSFGSIDYGSIECSYTPPKYNEIILNTTGIAYFQSKVGSTAKLCLRVSGDINNLEPTGHNYVIFHSADQLLPQRAPYIEVEYEVLTVTTSPATSVQATKITATGEVTGVSYDNAVTRRGFCYVAGAGTPDVDDNVVDETSDDFGKGEFSLIIEELSDYTQYSLRAFAEDEDGVIYGSLITFKTLPYTLEIGIPYSAAAVQNLRYAQDKDLMYFFHKSYKTRKLIRNSHTEWLFQEAPFTGGPFVAQQNIEEQTTNLITNGDMEIDGHWTTVGTPSLSEQSDERAYEGSYSWHIASPDEDDGIQSDSFTTETEATYRLRFRVFTAAEKFNLNVHDGSGTWIFEETIMNVPVNEWTEYERYWVETSGGTGAYIQFLTALTAEVEGYDSQYPPAQSSVYVKATTTWAPGFNVFAPHYATDPTKVLTGDAFNTSWLANAKNNQRFHIDCGEQVLIDRIYYENFHSYGLNTIRGVKNFTLWGSNSSSSFEELTYTTNTGWTRITCASTRFLRHSATNAADPKYIRVTPSQKYRYYAFKFADNYGDALNMGVRRIELQTADYVDDADIWIDKVEVNKLEAVYLTPSATTGNRITLTASKTFFEAGHNGAYFELTHGEDTGYVKITNVKSGTEAIAKVIEELGAATATAYWREGAWSTKNGWPGCGCFYEQRLVVASTKEDPDGVWGSKPTEYEDFEDGENATDAFGYKLQSDVIQWMAPMGQLVVGTSRSEMRLGSTDNTLDATSIKITPQSGKGCANIEAIGMGNAVLFIQRYGANDYGRKVRELSYDYTIDAYLSKDLTLFAEHVTGTGIIDWAYMSSPFPILWCVTSDGTLIGMTYEKEQNVIGWHQHSMGGTVESICVIPGENQDELWMIVKRTINGETKRYIEVMADFDFGGEIEGAYFVDCGITYDDDPATIIPGLNHLEGEEVAILADGVVQEKQTVTGGMITLETAASKVHVGLPKRAYIQPLDLIEGSVEGTGQGKQKKIHNVALSLYQTTGGKIGTDENNMEDIKYPDGTEDLYTGLTEDTVALGGWDKEVSPIIEQTDPLPMTVLAILPRYRTEDK